MEQEDVTIRKALSSYLRESGLDILMKNKAIIRTWCKVVGPEIAAQTRITGYEKGTLMAEVASSSLYAELSKFYLTEIVESMQRKMGNKKVRRIKLRLGEFGGEAEDGAEEHQGRR